MYRKIYFEELAHVIMEISKPVVQFQFPAKAGSLGTRES